MEQQNIVNRLERIEKTLKFIQNNMIDIDVILTGKKKRCLMKVWRMKNLLKNVK